MFPSEIGTPLEERNVLRRCQKICRENDLPNFDISFSGGLKSSVGLLGSFQVIGNRRLTDGTTQCDLALAQPQSVQSQQFLQLAHGQPRLRQPDSSAFQWSSDRRQIAQSAS